MLHKLSVPGNEKLMNAMNALERKHLFFSLEEMKHAKTSYEEGHSFIEKIRNEWTFYEISSCSQ